MFLSVWLVKALFRDIGQKDRARLAYGLGLWAPHMRPHWARLVRDRNGHSLVNIGTEWTRADPQRAWKLGIDGGLLAILVTVLAVQLIA